jgi:ubiquinone/menaquinone biosynthesis C-methylase UbiE
MTIAIARSNAEQATAWNGDAGAYWAAHHDIFEACLARYHRTFLHAAAIQPGDRVLDVGCGTGVTTRAAGRAAFRGQVLGVDLSAEMVGLAERLAGHEGLAHVSFLHADAQVHPFADESFDVTISHNGAAFFGDPHAAFTNLRRSLRPRGRLGLLTWRAAELQEWFRAFSEALTGGTPPAAAHATPGPFALSDEDHVRGLLQSTGFGEVELLPVSETTTYGSTVEEAHEFLLGQLDWMLRDQDPEQSAASVEALRTTLAAHQTDDGVRFGSAAWLVTAVRS